MINKIEKLIIPTPYPVGDVNAFVIKGEALTLIDAGPRTEEGRQALETGLAGLGLGMRDIEQIVLTHHHPDHAGGMDFFPDAKVLGHFHNQRWLEMNDEFVQLHDEFFTRFTTELGVPTDMAASINNYRGQGSISDRTVQTFLQEGQEVPGISGWRVIETPGHAQSHISLYREQDGVMIGGDHLLAKISPNPLMEPPLYLGGERPKPLIQYNNSLKKWLEIPVSLTYSGHGTEIENTHEHIHYNMNRQHERAMKVKKMLEENPTSGFEICKQLFPKVYQRELGLTLSETVGQLDYLEELGEISRANHSGKFIFSVNR